MPDILIPRGTAASKKSSAALETAIVKFLEENLEFRETLDMNFSRWTPRVTKFVRAPCDNFELLPAYLGSSLYLHDFLPEYGDLALQKVRHMRCLHGVDHEPYLCTRMQNSRCSSVYGCNVVNIAKTFGIACTDVFLVIRISKFCFRLQDLRFQIAKSARVKDIKFRSTLNF